MKIKTHYKKVINGEFKEWRPRMGQSPNMTQCVEVSTSITLHDVSVLDKAVKITGKKRSQILREALQGFLRGERAHSKEHQNFYVENPLNPYRSVNKRSEEAMDEAVEIYGSVLQNLAKR